MRDYNDITFFTNEDGESLDKRFRKVLAKNTRFFDALVGYFRMSGFHLIEEALENVEITRILVGINADEETLEAYREANGQITLESLNSAETIKSYKHRIVKEFENSEDSKEVENGISKLAQLIKENKLEIRVYTKQPIHAKIYIMRDYEDSPDFGRVITGSSNFSYSGLVSNLEFNVELKNKGDVEFALDRFETLWKESVDVTQDCIDTIENETWIKSDITPYEMYVKFLYEYFKEEINDDQNRDDLNRMMPDGFKPLQYQRDAVIQAKRVLEKHGGVFISDVVGLGKTFICSMLAQELTGYKLFLVPPVLIDYWKSTLLDFGVSGARVESTGKLKNIIEQEDISKYSYVFVDEAHKFRNSETEQYKHLHQICYGKKVVLISATPQNNYSSDIANQLYLFEKKRNSTLPLVRNLENFFKTIQASDNRFEKGSSDYKTNIKNTSELIRDRILREVMIRRTRSEIQKNYADDLKKQKLKFPKVSEPIRMVYEFDEETEKVFDKTVEIIAKMTYARYKPLTYVKPELLTPVQRTLLVGQQNLGKFMKGILVKRLESSRRAFELTIERFIKSYEGMLKMLSEKGYLVISKKLDILDLYDKDELDKILEAIENEEATKITKESLNENFLVHMNKDIDALKSLKKLWSTVKNDIKMDTFINALKKDAKLKKNKILIFTESKETAEYLKEELEDKLKENILMFSGSSSDTLRSVIKANFDPNYLKNNQKDDYRILVTTDVLAEGMNLHRSNVIFNFDLPWNPTRVMQRVGRINRVGTEFDEIHIFNFFPTSKSNEHLSQEENIVSKIQRFHYMLGEDAQYLTDEEAVDSFELFKRMSANPADEDEGFDSELSYLKKIRDIRDKDIELFKKVKNMPKKIKIGREPKESWNGVLTFFRKGYVKKFFTTISTENGNETKELTFEDAIEIVTADTKEKSKKIIDKYFELLESNKVAFDESEKEMESENLVVSTKGASNAQSIITVLKETIKAEAGLTNEEIVDIDRIIELLKNGVLPTKILQEGNKLIKKVDYKNYRLINYYKEFSKMIPETYFINDINGKKKKNENKEIILSEVFY